MKSTPFYRLQQFIGKSIPIIILTIYALIAVFPIVMILINSFKDKSAIFGSPFQFPNLETFSLIGYETVFKRATFSLYFLNSSIVTFTALILTLFIEGSVTEGGQTQIDTDHLRGDYWCSAHHPSAFSAHKIVEAQR